MATDTRTLRLLDPPRYRQTEGGTELWYARTGSWRRVKPWTAPLIDAIIEGADLDALLALAPRIPVSKDPIKAETRTRLFLFTLFRIGHIDLARPPPVTHPRYRIEKELGRGGVAVADQARDTQTGRSVVVKRAWDFLQPYRITESAIRNEAEVLRAFDNPGIAHLHDTFESDGHLHLVRDLVEGTDLLHHIDGGIRDDARLGTLARGLLDILGHIHDHGHLLIDLRPANFFLTRNDDLILVDVGQCRPHKDGHIRFDRRIGSRGFLSPEMEASHEVTYASDLYGLGVLLVALRTGTVPDRRIRRDRLARHLANDPWGPFLLTLLEKEPKDRPQNVQEADALLKTTGPG